MSEVVFLFNCDGRDSLIDDVLKEFVQSIFVEFYELRCKHGPFVYNLKCRGNSKIPLKYIINQFTKKDCHLHVVTTKNFNMDSYYLHNMNPKFKITLWTPDYTINPLESMLTWDLEIMKHRHINLLQDDWENIDNDESPKPKKKSLLDFYQVITSTIFNL